MAVVDAPLAPLLHAPPTTLALTAQRKPTGAIAMRVSTDGAKDTAAILVELSLRDADGRRLPYVSISRNFVTMLSGESLEAVAEVLWDGKLAHNAALGGAVSLAGVSACAETPEPNATNNNIVDITSPLIHLLGSTSGDSTPKRASC